MGEYKWNEGFVSGAVYNFDPKVIDLMTKVYSKVIKLKINLLNFNYFIFQTAYTNPLHPDIFPGNLINSLNFPFCNKKISSGICKMEAEVLRMVANLFNGNSNTCGVSL